MTLSAAILVGGLSRRMGKNKALLRLGPGLVLQRMLDTARQAVDGPICLVGRAGELEPYRDAFPKLALVTDGDRPRCVLAGIEAAIHWAGGRVLVLACDLPMVPPALLTAMVSHAPAADVVAIESPKGSEPLLAVYGTGCVGPICRAFDQGRFKAVSFHDEVVVELFPEARRVALDPEGRAFWNMNTPQDYQRILAVFEPAD